MNSQTSLWLQLARQRPNVGAITSFVCVSVPMPLTAPISYNTIHVSPISVCIDLFFSGPSLKARTQDKWKELWQTPWTPESVGMQQVDLPVTGSWGTTGKAHIPFALPINAQQAWGVK